MWRQGDLEGSCRPAACHVYHDALEPEVVEILECKQEVKVTWVSRSANASAHKLARVGVGEEVCKVWIMVPTDFILAVVSHEISDLLN